MCGPGGWRWTTPEPSHRAWAWCREGVGTVWGRSKAIRALVRAPGAGSWWRCLGDGDAKGAACVWLCMWGSGQGMPPACVPFGDHSNSTKEGDAHPPIPPSAWAGSWGGGTSPAPATAGFQPCPAPGSCWEGSGLTVASPALLVPLNLPPSLTRASQRELCAHCGCPCRWGWVEEQSSAFFPGSGSGFPQAWALCHSRHGEIRASLSTSPRPGAVALRERVCRSWWPALVAGLGLCWGPGEGGTGVPAAVGSLLLVSPGGSLRAGQGGGRSWLLAGVHWSLELSHEVVG